MIKKLSMVFGAIFLVIGLLGFVPGVTTADGLLLGIFQVSPLHNIIHILSGAAALLAINSASNSRLWFRIFGTVYALVALVGWIQGSNVLGLIEVNVADNLLHTVLAVAILGIGFGLSRDDEVSEVRA